ncbi:MAG TPA: hypothetical protein PKG92_10180, partial [Anaerolineaceae bacterium]|nr:hypothetical protein [Anaerolineaceae bacterium]
YRLSDDGTEWVPLIPESISAQLAVEVLPEKDANGDWLLRKDGKTQYKWDATGFKWVPADPVP